MSDQFGALLRHRLWLHKKGDSLMSPLDFLEEGVITGNWHGVRKCRFGVEE